MGPEVDINLTGDELWEEKMPSSPSSSLENGGAIGEIDCSSAVCTEEPLVPNSGDSGVEDICISFCWRKLCVAVDFGVELFDGCCRRC